MISTPSGLSRCSLRTAGRMSKSPCPLPGGEYGDAADSQARRGHGKLIRSMRDQGQPRPRWGVEEPLGIDHGGRVLAIKDLDQMAGVADGADHEEMTLSTQLGEEQHRPLDGGTPLRKDDGVEPEVRNAPHPRVVGGTSGPRHQRCRARIGVHPDRENALSGGASDRGRPCRNPRDPPWAVPQRRGPCPASSLRPRHPIP